VKRRHKNNFQLGASTWRQSSATPARLILDISQNCCTCFLNKSWNNLSHTPSLLHSQHAMQRTTWPPAIAWEPSHPHSWCVYVCAFACAKYWQWPRIKLSDTVLPPHPWTTVKNKREERCGRPPPQGKREKETWERHRWRQSELCQQFECWDCGNAINVWRGYKSFWIETHMHCYAWLLMYWLSNGKQVLCTHLDHPHILQGEKKIKIV